ncbi:MAG: hypothetical protein IKO02_08820, partial [Lentisphaeria bacterium]|nr:hypothetical protein [Lentisphaeria bacterium]
VLGGEHNRLNTIRGTVPSPDKFGRGCRFCDRCEHADTLTPEQRRRCQEEPPSLRELVPGHACACHYPPCMTGKEA